MSLEVNPRILAVMYHYVRDRAGTEMARVRGLEASAFGEQLDCLCRRFEPITWPMLFAWRRGEADLPRESLLLTFDDGLADHIEVVAPALEMRGLRGVFFVPAQILESGHMLGVHQIHILQARIGDDVLAGEIKTWLGTHCPEIDWFARVDSDQARLIYHYESDDRALLKYLLAFILPAEMRSQMIEEIFDERIGNSRAFSEEWYMNWDDVVTLSAAGHTIGGHGYAHEPLLTLSPQDQFLELSRSGAQLRQVLGPESRPMSYPFGSVDQEVARRCEDVGFVHGFTTQADWILAGSNAHLLGRVDTIEVDAFLERQEACTLH